MCEELEQKIIARWPQWFKTGGDTASALLRYWELRVSNYLPTAISLLEDM
jgi:hypothetical protein